MILKIKCKVTHTDLLPLSTQKGDWFDLKSAEDITMTGPHLATDGDVYFETRAISLGVAMELPKGFEAILAPRSSLFKEKGLVLRNSIGIIDNSYCGNEDIWKFQAIAYKKCIIRTGERICQFRIQLSQKASIWAKLKWLFTTKIIIVEVDDLKNSNRGGFGSTDGYKQ